MTCVEMAEKIARVLEGGADCDFESAESVGGDVHTTTATLLVETADGDRFFVEVHHA